MAEIAPFRGLRYNPDKVPDLNKVVTPPYDVISVEEQESFHQLSPYNMVRLELGKATPEDSEGNNPHTRAARHLAQWQEQGVLARDPLPAVYYYELDYSLEANGHLKRYGFICLLKLEDFRSGSVRPHEKTFQAVKDERLGLMLACHANLSPVFALYADPAGTVDGYLQREVTGSPVADFTDSRGMGHRLWRVENLETLERVRAFLLDKDIFIADGHHRYETGLAYRDIQRERNPGSSPRAPFEYIMVYLASMNQPGMTILPTHRMLRNLVNVEPEPFVRDVRDYFEVAMFEGSEAGEAAWRRELENAGARKENVVGFHCRSAGNFYLFRARKERVSAFLSDIGISEVLHDLDVVILDQLLLKRFLKLTETFLADDSNIHFKHDLTEALGQLRAGRYDAGFFINPTRIEQVEKVAGAGFIMPHKSTYFYPKVLSGLLINHPLVSDEQIVW